MAEFLEVCEEAARRAADVLGSWQGRVTAREKAPADLVTEADVAAQECIREVVQSAFPAHEFIGEEGGNTGPAQESPYRWIVDPLDGTTNFVHGLRQFSVSVALAHGANILCGTVYDPSSDECFTAAAGGGAFLNGVPIRVSGESRLADALVSASFPSRVTRDHPLIQEFIQVLTTSQAIRRMGSSALNLSYLAAGRFDAYWANHVKMWDVAAGILLVREAGGVVTGPTGEPFDIDHPRFVAAATNQLHGELLRVLGRVPSEPANQS